MIADYSTTGVSIERHPLALLREQLAGRGAALIAELHARPPRQRTSRSAGS